MLLNLGKNLDGKPVDIAGRFLNRHCLVTGGTGGGKSVTLTRMIEGLSAAGVPCLAVDVKGDLAGMAKAGIGSGLPVDLICVYGAGGRYAPLAIDRTGADLTARALSLSQAQSGVLEIAFELSRDKGLPLATLPDLRDILDQLGRQAGLARYGHVSKASTAVIRRAMLRLPPEAFDPASFDPGSMLRCLPDGKGIVTLLDATRLVASPALYSATLLAWVTELYDRLPERGDRAKPIFAVFLDEAHLLFTDLAPSLLAGVERIARLIRSKGVMLVFASQSPDDIPSVIAGQLGSRVQHAMRAATPRDLAAVKAAADSMPCRPGFDAAAAIGRLRPGEALASVMLATGSPSPVQIIRVAWPGCRIGPLTADERMALVPPVVRRDKADEQGGTLAAALVLSGLLGVLIWALVQIARDGMAWVGLPMAGAIALLWHRIGKPVHRHFWRRH